MTFMDRPPLERARRYRFCLIKIKLSVISGSDVSITPLLDADVNRYTPSCFDDVIEPVLM